jgi:hypothetical protein
MELFMIPTSTAISVAYSQLSGNALPFLDPSIICVESPLTYCFEMYTVYRSFPSFMDFWRRNRSDNPSPLKSHTLVAAEEQRFKGSKGMTTSGLVE